MKLVFLYSLIIGFCFIVGVSFFLIQRNLLIVYFAFDSTQATNSLIAQKKDSIIRRKVKLYFWQNASFQHEEVDLIWFPFVAENIKHIVNLWLAFLYDERMLDSRVYLETVAVAEFERRAYLSFDFPILHKEWSIQKKWYFLESLCRTICSVDISVNDIVFLVNHRPMLDDHICLAQPWPLTGFL